MSRVGSPRGGGIGLAPIHGAHPRGTVTRDGLGEEARDGLPSPLLWEEAIKDLPSLLSSGAPCLHGAQYRVPSSIAVG